MTLLGLRPRPSFERVFDPTTLGCTARQHIGQVAELRERRVGRVAPSPGDTFLYVFKPGPDGPDRAATQPATRASRSAPARSRRQARTQTRRRDDPESRRRIKKAVGAPPHTPALTKESSA